MTHFEIGRGSLALPIRHVGGNQQSAILPQYFSGTKSVAILTHFEIRRGSLALPIRNVGGNQQSATFQVPVSLIHISHPRLNS